MGEECLKCSKYISKRFYHSYFVTTINNNKKRAYRATSPIPEQHIQRLAAESSGQLQKKLFNKCRGTRNKITELELHVFKDKRDITALAKTEREQRLG